MYACAQAYQICVKRILQIQAQFNDVLISVFRLEITLPRGVVVECSANSHHPPHPKVTLSAKNISAPRIELGTFRLQYAITVERDTVQVSNCTTEKFERD